MPFWVCALLSGVLFGLGLFGSLWRRPAQALRGMLMLHGAALLSIAASAQLQQPEGAAVSLLIVGLLAVECFVGLARRR